MEILCIAGDAVSTLLSILREEDAIYSTEAQAWPSIVQDQLFVERTHVLDMSGMSPSQQLLLWGISFSVLCQKLSFTAVHNTAVLLSVHILRSDTVFKLPNELRSVWGRLTDTTFKDTDTTFVRTRAE